MNSCRPATVRNPERGVALVMAIVVLLVISLLAAMIMQNLSIERKISGHGLRTSRALSAADAGIAEVVSRLRSGDLELDQETPGSAVQIFLTTAGLVPAVGSDTSAYPTLQSSGAWLDYSTASRSEDVLTLAFRLDETSGEIIRYDELQTPPYNTACGMPVMRITSTGKVHGDRTRVRAEIIRKPYHLGINAALCSGVNVTLAGSASICGYQHSATTSFDDGALGRVGSPSCVGHEVGSGNLPGIWTGGALANNGAQVAGTPSASVEGQGGFYDGPWELMGITQAEFTDMLGSHTTFPDSYDGVVWLDDDGTPANGSQLFNIADLAGEGVLYVDGDLSLTGVVTFRGLLFVEGDFTSNATGTVVGSVVVRGGAVGSCSITNGPSMVYSRDAVNQAIAKATKEFVTLSWREVR